MASRISLTKILLVYLLISSFSTSWASQRIVIADFSSGTDENGIPSGWQLKERSGNADFSVIKERNIYALHLRSADTSFALQKLVNVNIRQYPLFSWKWKVSKLPEGGDFRNWETDDQAAQLFVAFSNRKILVYIWDTCAPKGLIGDAWAPPFMTIKAIVVRSGPTETGKWINEVRNAQKDYRKFFGHEPPNVAAIRIQINSQHTNTYGESFFADLVFKKQ